MKRFENIFRTLLVLVASLAAGTTAHAQADERLQLMNDVEVGLITCSPHDEVYSLYGHSALHWYDKRTQQHLVFNYGIFDQKKSNFAWRFMMGQTDYRLECTDAFEGFCHYYAGWGSSVEEQVLNLTPAEKVKLWDALTANLKDPVYRYNIFYDNCSTRPRNIVEANLEGTVIYAPRPGYEPTYREIVHQKTENHPWAAFGNDLLLGLFADHQTTQREQQFLPANLSYDFDHAIVDRQGIRSALVLRHVTHVPAQPQSIRKGFPLSPRACTLLLLLVTLLIVFYEMRRKRLVVIWDALLMLLTGLPGCVLLLMVFSDHPTTSINLQILLLNPLALVFIPMVVRRRPTRWFKLNAIFLLLFFLGSCWQDYAEGMTFVALTLLIRCIVHIRHDK